jgi:PAS domain S-box-containing protein
MPLRELLRSSDIFTQPLALLAPDGSIDVSNNRFAAELGLDVRGLAGKRLDALAAASASAIEEFVRACAQSSDVVQGSFLFRRHAESVALQARGIAYPPSAAPSASQVLLHLFRDPERTSPPGARQSSRRREVEDSLRRQSQILEVTLASIGDAVIVTDDTGRVTFLNSVAEALTGWDAPSAQNRPLTEVFPIINEQTRAPVENPVSKVLETGAVMGLANHTVLLARDGREVPIGDSAAPIRLPGGALFGVVLIFRDITEQRRAEVTRGWLASIIESSDDAIISKTLDGRITSWNPGAVRLFGYSPEEIIGRSITTIVPPELHDEEEAVLEKLRHGERIDHFETTRLTKEGRHVEVSLTVSPIRDEEGAVVGASKIARDITERKRAERQLREADRRKDEFLAVIAHELRNPLAPIRNASAVLARSVSGQPGARLACDIIDRQLRMMTRLVDDLLDVSRIAEGRIDLQFELIDMAALLDTVQGSLQPSFDSALQVSTIHLPTGPVCVMGDRIRLVQVFFNILQNAHKYTPAGGRIDVSLSRETRVAVVRVRDTGIGIPSEMVEKVFELFTQVDVSHDRTRGGLGIGLTLARRLLELHNGSITVQSGGEGQGSEFTIRLPCHDSTAPRGEPPPRQADPRD